MANTEIQFIKKRLNQLEDEMRNLLIVLMDLKMLKIKIDENGKLSYDTGKDDE